MNDHQDQGEQDKKRRLKKAISLLKSWNTPSPDYENLDFSRWCQSEAQYQEEQRQWLADRRQKKKTDHSKDSAASSDAADGDKAPKTS